MLFFDRTIKIGFGYKSSGYPYGNLVLSKALMYTQVLAN